MENTTTVSSPTRTLYDIAAEIRKDWIDPKTGKSKVNFAAKPYLDAMAQMTSVRENFGADTGKYVVLYFLSNATSWKGDVARRVKAELKAMCK